MYKPTTALKKIRSLKKRIKGLQGGTSASKTIGALMVEIDFAQRNSPKSGNDITSVVSESMPHLKKGAIRDFKGIMQAHGYWRESNWNATDKIYTFETGWPIEFFSVDQADKVRGPRRARLFGNECNNWNNGLEVFNQLEVRTRDSITLDWNPSSEFWWHTDIMTNPDLDAEMVILTYKDNEALDPQIVKSIEARQNNKIWWQVYGLGQLGEIETRIYTGWTILDTLPEGCRLERRGLDFGYTNDPSSLIAIYKYNDGYILDEELYRKGMTNKDIADYVKGLDDFSKLIIADSAEPKSIDELKLYNLNVLPTTKGRDSVRKGIQLIQGLPIFVTKRSTNLIKEYRNYLWLTDKDGKVLNEPTPGMDHALDAVRYAINSLFPYAEPNSESLAIY